MVTDKRLDAELLKLQREHVQTLAAWHQVKPDRAVDDASGWPREVREKFDAAMAAEGAYLDRMRALGLI